MANQPQQPDTALHNASHLMQYHDLIESIVAALDARDAYTASHSDRVADMVLVLAAALGLDEDETTRIHMAAHLHDIGKIAVPDSVLRKAGPLTRPEWEEMRRHPVTGYEILRKIDDFARLVVDLVRKICHRRIAGRLDRLRLVQRSQLLPQLVELIVDHGHGAVLVHRRYLLVHCNLFAIRTVIDHHAAGCL